MTTVNTITPSAHQTTGTPSAPTPGLGKQDFLKLLITQLRYQDPLNPLDQNQFMTQTAQFTQLESLQNIDRGLTSLQSTMAGSALTQAASLIGKSALATGADFTFDGAPTALPFAVDAEASAVKLEVLDGNGAVIRALSRGSVAAGADAFTWDGADGQGQPVSPGTYHYRVSAQGARAGAAAGVITGLHADGGELTYLIGDATVRPNDLVDVR
jgi:flagellar basal-body rod modification protein FlgD